MKSTRRHKIIEIAPLLALRESYRRDNKTIVWTNGHFDLLHRGHIASLKSASELGDILVVGINCDESCRTLKGNERPLLPAADRVEIVAALECVDHVLIFPDSTPIRILQLLQPEVHCKGMDYAPERGKPLPERATVEGYGGRIVFLPLTPGISTTELIRRIRNLRD